MLTNIHTHTMRCGHAAGEDRAYVETAIRRGVRVLGFSEHVPMPFPDGHESRHRMPIRLLGDYVASILALREEYRDRIEIHLGFEAEYYPDLFDAMANLLSPYPMEYLLLAGHYSDSSESIYNTCPQDDETALVRYTDALLAAMRTGRFTYLAHPDLFCFTGSRSVYRREAQRLCEGAKACGMPLEINLLGVREHRDYPNPHFWEVASEVGCRAVLGCDAHTPEDLADPDNIREAEAFARRFGIEPERSIALIKPF